MPTLRLVPASGSAPIEVTQDSALVGRETACDVVVADGSVSRRHARIERRGDDFVIIDQASANGTFLDLQKISESTLKHGQALRLGAVEFRVEIAGAKDLAATGEVDATVVHAIPELPPPAPVVVVPPTPAAPVPVPLPTLPPPAAPATPASSPGLPRTTPAPPPPPPPSAKPARPATPPGPGRDAGKKKRGPLFWLGAGCCGCLTAVLLLFGTIVGVVGFTTRDSVTAVRLQLGEIKAGDLDAAYQRLTEMYQTTISREDFRLLVAAHPSLRDNVDSTFLSRSRNNGVVTLSGTLTASTGEKEEVTYLLVEEDGAWKIGSIRFAGDEIRVPDAPTESSP